MSSFITTAKKLALALGVVSSLAVAYGCASTEDDNGEPAPAASEDDLSFGAGSVDHAAIVEVSTMMLVGDPTTFATVLDPYNEDDPFRIHGSAYAGRFQTNLARFDGSDQKIDWTRDQTQAWVSRISNGNYLIVDTSKPCDFADPHTYLEIERAKLTGKEHTTCGGRMPNEDALDVTVNFLIRGPSATAQDEGAIHDGVEQATTKASNTFPYLAELNGF